MLSCFCAAVGEICVILLHLAVHPDSCISVHRSAHNHRFFLVEHADERKTAELLRGREMTARLHPGAFQKADV